MFCLNCENKMTRVMQFENKKSSEFYRCLSCYFETKPKRLILDDEFDMKKDKNKQNNKNLKKQNKKIKNKKGKRKSNDNK